MFGRFDRRVEELGLEKIKIIGDAYMAVGGLPIPRSDHAHICAEMALGMFDDLKAFNQQHSMESTSQIGRIQVSPIVREAISDQYELEERELIECKGLGPILTSFLTRKK